MAAHTRVDLYDLQTRTSETKIFTTLPRADAKPIAGAPIGFGSGLVVLLTPSLSVRGSTRSAFPRARQGTVLWVLGAGRELDKPQLWVERDTGRCDR